jgi:hypothetical protein
VSPCEWANISAWQVQENARVEQAKMTKYKASQIKMKGELDAQVVEKQLKARRCRLTLCNLTKRGMLIKRWYRV